MMNVDLPTILNSSLLGSTKTMEGNNTTFNKTTPPTTTADSREALQTVNEASRLLQIVTSKLSGAVIRKVSPSEYAQLIAVLDQIIRDSIDEQV
ncbi:hypothetical protein Lnau_1360 [Legionella nautarum]|uniref:FlaG protein n=1 Tax=Legionella nautarum TaxID=45070 RepID=A0A0W0WVN1_9GAMM|nr:hypothetical protein [Legionella nautarum]KTD36376.1 hypothetical protein Lnau_1360 [Legionella nautarum]